jgi:hypothetical protein
VFGSQLRDLSLSPSCWQVKTRAYYSSRPLLKKTILFHVHQAKHLEREMNHSIFSSPPNPPGQSPEVSIWDSYSPGCIVYPSNLCRFCRDRLGAGAIIFLSYWLEK